MGNCRTAFSFLPYLRYIPVKVRSARVVKKACMDLNGDMPGKSGNTGG